MTLIQKYFRYPSLTLVLISFLPVLAWGSDKTDLKPVFDLLKNQRSQILTPAYSLAQCKKQRPSGDGKVCPAHTVLWTSKVKVQFVYREQRT
jgi:hypothetical protein